MVILNALLELHNIKIRSACEIGGINLLDGLFIDSNNKTISLKQEGLLESIERQSNKLVNKKTIKEINNIAKDLINTPSKYQSKEL